MKVFIQKRNFTPFWVVLVTTLRINLTIHQEVNAKSEFQRSIREDSQMVVTRKIAEIISPDFMSKQQVPNGLKYPRWKSGNATRNYRRQAYAARSLT